VFQEPSISESHPCKAAKFLPNFDLTAFFKSIPWDRYMKRRFVMIIGGALVGLVVLLAMLRKETATQAQPPPSSVGQSPNGPKSDTLSIEAFMDSYRQALVRQNPSLILRHFPAYGNGALVLYYGKLVLQAMLRKETATQTQPPPSSVGQSPNVPKTGILTIQTFMDSYRQALVRQDPSLMLRHFPAHGNGTLVLYYGKRMTAESLAQTLTASSQTEPVIIRSAETKRLMPVSSTQYRCQAYIATLSLDLETKTQKRQKEVRLYVLEPQPGRFAILSENNVPLIEPTTQAEDFAKKISRALVRQEPDFLISLYPSLLSGTKVRYYEKDRDSIWIYADMIETSIMDPLEVQRASILSKSDLITSADGHSYYNLRIELTFRTLSSPAWRKKEIAILFEKQGSSDFQIFLEENVSP